MYYLFIMTHLPQFESPGFDHSMWRTISQLVDVKRSVGVTEVTCDLGGDKQGHGFLVSVGTNGRVLLTCPMDFYVDVEVGKAEQGDHRMFVESYLLSVEDPILSATTAVACHDDSSEALDWYPAILRSFVKTFVHRHENPVFDILNEIKNQIIEDSLDSETLGEAVRRIKSCRG